MRVRVNRTACIGSGTCEAFAPHIFHVDQEGKAVVNEAAAAEADEGLLWDAADGCPSLAIILQDDEGHQLYPQ
ncbi:MAG: ferredoxin [Ardenticatenaceae bacterium]|nr:ferredoxin [Ardenticatenaceae bacterium]